MTSKTAMGTLLTCTSAWHAAADGSRLTALLKLEHRHYPAGHPPALTCTHPMGSPGLSAPSLDDQHPANRNTDSDPNRQPLRPPSLVLVHPPARVGQQEAQRLPVACRQGGSEQLKEVRSRRSSGGGGSSGGRSGISRQWQQQQQQWWRRRQRRQTQQQQQHSHSQQHVCGTGTLAARTRVGAAEVPQPASQDGQTRTNFKRRKQQAASASSIAHRS